MRVGRKGKHRGSQGLYPATVSGRSSGARHLMAQGYTIQDIQRELLSLRQRDRSGRQQLEQVLAGVERALREGAGEADEVSRARDRRREAALERVGRELRAIEQRLAMRARMARAAV